MRRFAPSVQLLATFGALAAIVAVAVVVLTVPAVHVWTIAGIALVLLYVGALMMGVGQRTAEVPATTRRQREAHARRTAQAWWAVQQPPRSRGGNRLN